MKTNARLYFLLVILFFLVACIKTQEASKHSYFPMEVGKEWEYVMEDDLLSNSIVSVEKITSVNDSSIVYEVIITYDYDNFIFAFTVMSSGLYEVVNDTFFLLLPNEPKIGDVWETHESYREVTSLNQSLETPLGNYSGLLEIKETSLDDHRVRLHYYQEGVGAIAATTEEGKFISYLNENSR